MIYVWIYLALGIIATAGMLYWDVKYEKQTFYVRDIWRIVGTFLIWPIMFLVGMYLLFEDKYGDKKLF